MAHPDIELAEAVEALLLTLEGFVATCDGAVKNGDPCLNLATFEAGNKLYCAEHARLVSDETPLVESDFGVKVRRVRALLAQVKGGR